MDLNLEYLLTLCRKREGQEIKERKPGQGDKRPCVREL